MRTILPPSATRATTTAEEPPFRRFSCSLVRADARSGHGTEDARSPAAAPPRPSAERLRSPAFALAWLLGCAPSSAVDPPIVAETPPPTADSSCRPIHAIAGETTPVRVRLSQAPSDAWPDNARLVLSRLAPAQAAAFADDGFVHDDGIMPFIRTSRVYEVDPRELVGDGVTCPLAVDPAGPAHPVALLEPGGEFWRALFSDSGHKLVGAASSPGGPVELRSFGVDTPDRAPPSTPPHCVGPRFVHLEFDDPSRHACALLPTDHDPKRSYPVVYMLSGFAGDDTTRFGSTFTTIVDTLAATSGRPALYVGVDTRTDAGSLYPTAERSAPWLDWLTTTLPSAVESRLGGRPDASALFGQSTGGFNAITIAMLRPDVFRAVGVSAPDALDLGEWLLEGDTIDPRWLAWMRLEDGVGGPGQMVSYARAWSADGTSMPVDLDSGELRAAVLERWLAHAPIVMVDDPSHQTALRSLDGQLWIALADNDEFGLTAPAQRFADRLDALGIDHQVLLDHAGHFGLDQRLPVLFAAILAALEGPKTEPRS